MLEIIGNDLFNIARRLKSINPKYVIFREQASGRVEVHNSNRPCVRSLEFVVPFNELDERTLEYAQKTRIENFDAIEQQQAEANAKIAFSAKQHATKVSAKLYDMMDYASNQVNEVVFKKSKKWF